MAAKVREGRLAIEGASLAAIEALIIDGLTADAARDWLTKIPTVDSLVGCLDFLALESRVAGCDRSWRMSMSRASRAAAYPIGEWIDMLDALPRATDPERVLGVLPSRYANFTDAGASTRPGRRWPQTWTGA